MGADDNGDAPEDCEVEINIDIDGCERLIKKLYSQDCYPSKI